MKRVQMEYRLTVQVDVEDSVEIPALYAAGRVSVRAEAVCKPGEKKLMIVSSDIELLEWYSIW